MTPEEYEGRSISDRSPDRPSVALDPIALRALAERLAQDHVESQRFYGYCVCGGKWPCDQMRASAAIPALLDANEQTQAVLASEKAYTAHLTAEVAALRAQLADIEALRALSEAATPGEWRTWNDGHVGSPSAHIGGIFMPTEGSDFDRQMPDACFVAAAVNAVRAALSVPAVPEEKP